MKTGMLFWRLLYMQSLKLGVVLGCQKLVTKSPGSATAYLHIYNITSISDFHFRQCSMYFTVSLTIIFLLFVFSALLLDYE